MSEATIPARGPVDVLVGRLRVAATKLGRSDEWEDLRDDLHHAAAEIERLRAAETEMLGHSEKEITERVYRRLGEIVEPTK